MQHSIEIISFETNSIYNQIGQ